VRIVVAAVLVCSSDQQHRSPGHSKLCRPDGTTRALQSARKGLTTTPQKVSALPGIMVDAGIGGGTISMNMDGGSRLDGIGQDLRFVRRGMTIMLIPDAACRSRRGQRDQRPNSHSGSAQLNRRRVMLEQAAKT
jgi:hypothetical protein